MNRRVVAAAVALLVAPVVFAQDPQRVVEPGKHTKQQRPASGLILGRVVDAISNQLVAGARVTLAGREGARGQGASTTVLATDTGYSLFRDLAAGSYTIAAAAPTYLPG